MRKVIAVLAIMNIVVGIVGGAIIGYLFVSVLRPEWF